MWFRFTSEGASGSYTTYSSMGHIAAPSAQVEYQIYVDVGKIVAGEAGTVGAAFIGILGCAYVRAMIQVKGPRQAVCNWMAGVGFKDAAGQAHIERQVIENFWKLIDSLAQQSKSELPWAVLGLGGDVGEAEARSAYRKLARQHHPDVGGEEKKFKEVGDAWDKICKAKGWS
jgi:hypothetical protein